MAQGEYLFECFTVYTGKQLGVNPPPGYFFLSSAPCGFILDNVPGGVVGAARVLVTWRKQRNAEDPGPAPPVTAAPILRALKPAKKKASKRRARGRR